MSEDEIRELAAALGLDPKQLQLLEPYESRYLKSKVYTMKYRGFDWNFRLSAGVSGTHREAIEMRCAVHEGLMSLKRLEESRITIRP